MTRTIELRLSRLQEVLGSIETDRDTDRNEQDQNELTDLPATIVEQTLSVLGFELQAHSTNNNGDRHLDQDSAAVKMVSQSTALSLCRH
jgi:hypothetical protein